MMRSRSDDYSEEVMPKELRDKIQKIILCLPQDGLLHTFAYGSAVFKQQDRDLGSMIDLILVVEDVEKWHAENLKVNYDHYSSARILGPKFIGYVNENIGSGVYYNTYAEICGAVVKYGVISFDTFQEDMLTWKFMYVAGRLHKPVLDFPSSNPRPRDGYGRDLIRSIVKLNRKAAFNLALLFLPAIFTRRKLYETIAALSYTGDSRMLVGGERENKIGALVLPIEDVYDGIYVNSVLIGMGKFVRVDPDHEFVQIVSPEVRRQRLMALPGNLQTKVVESVLQERARFLNCPSSFFRLVGPPQTLREDQVKRTLEHLSQSQDLPFIVLDALSKTIFSASVRQTAVGLFSTGFRNSIYYAYEKLMKSGKPKAIEKAAEDKSQ